MVLGDTNLRGMMRSRAPGGMGSFPATPQISQTPPTVSDTTSSTHVSLLKAFTDRPDSPLAQHRVRRWASTRRTNLINLLPNG